jgi:hypothetical protein
MTNIQEMNPLKRTSGTEKRAAASAVGLAYFLGAVGGVVFADFIYWEFFRKKK